MLITSSWLLHTSSKATWCKRITREGTHWTGPRRHNFWSTWPVPDPIVGRFAGWRSKCTLKHQTSALNEIQCSRGQSMHSFNSSVGKIIQCVNSSLIINYSVTSIFCVYGHWSCVHFGTLQGRQYRTELYCTLSYCIASLEKQSSTVFGDCVLELNVCHWSWITIKLKDKLST